MTAGVAHAGNGTAQAQVNVVKRLSFIQADDLEFGTIIAGPTAGTVVVSPFGGRTKTGGITLVSGLVQPATFAGYGANNQLVTISVSANSYVMTRVGGTQTMQFDSFIVGSTPTAPITTSPRTFRIVSPTGLFEFPLGATLKVGANQTPGNYVGVFSVILNYQ
jgi:Domain of unknown function (DUF4402)